MELTEDTYILYAAKHYDNPLCFSEKEFYSDLKLISTIKRMISWLNNGDTVNLKLLVNNVLSFYNVFEHHAASKLLEFKTSSQHWAQLNAILVFLSMPTIYDGTFDLILHRKIAQGYKE